MNSSHLGQEVSAGCELFEKEIPPSTETETHVLDGEQKLIASFTVASNRSQNDSRTPTFSTMTTAITRTEEEDLNTPCTDLMVVYPNLTVTSSISPPSQTHSSTYSLRSSSSHQYPSPTSTVSSVTSAISTSSSSSMVTPNSCSDFRSPTSSSPPTCGSDCSSTSSISPDMFSIPMANDNVQTFPNSSLSSSFGDAPSLSPDSAAMTPEQREHIASLVRKTKKKRFGPTNHPHILSPHQLSLPTTPNFISPTFTSPTQSPTLVFGKSPRNNNIFKLKLPTSNAKPILSPAVEVGELEENEAPDMNQFNIELDDEINLAEVDDGDDEDDEDDFAAETTPGNAGLGMEEEFGEIILMGIHDSRKPCGSPLTSSSSSSSFTNLSALVSESENEHSPTGVSDRLSQEVSAPTDSSTDVSNSSDYSSVTNPPLTIHHSTSLPQVSEAILPFTTHHILHSCSVEPPQQSKSSPRSTSIEGGPLGLAGRRERQSRRSSCCGTLDTRFRPPPYDFNSSGALLIDGWEIGKRGVIRTPELSRAMSRGASASCDNSPSMRSVTQSQQASEPVTRRNSGSSLTGRVSLTDLSSLRGAAQSLPCSPMGSPRHHPTLNHSFSTFIKSAFGPKFKLPKPATGLGIELKLSDLVRLGEIGRGVNGAVYKAIYLPTLTIVALKSVSIFDKAERHQFLQELHAFLYCTSPHILKFIGACFSEGKITMALEYLNRGSLDKVIAKSGPLPEPFLKVVAKQLLSGLRDLHGQAFLHRDIKPANFLVNHLGEAKVSDFGLLKQLIPNENGMYEDSKFVGTMHYLSPERIAGQKFSFPSDVYGAGLSFIYLATGSLKSCIPEKADYWALVQGALSTHDFVPPSLPLESTNGTNHFSPDLRDFIHHMMAKDPNDRWTVEQLLQHPFIRMDDEDEVTRSAALAGWSGHALEEPDSEELSILLEAVLKRWYPTKELLRYPVPFQLSTFDLTRFTHLAQQLGWSTEPVIQAFTNQIHQRVKELHDTTAHLSPLMNETDIESCSTRERRFSTTSTTSSSTHRLCPSDSCDSLVDQTTSGLFIGGGASAPRPASYSHPSSSLSQCVCEIEARSHSVHNSPSHLYQPPLPSWT